MLVRIADLHLCTLLSLRSYVEFRLFLVTLLKLTAETVLSSMSFAECEIYLVRFNSTLASD